MFDYSFLISILISISALLLALYREFKGPDISLLNEPTFKLTDMSLGGAEEYVPRWFNFNEVSLVFANYGGKGGTILDVKIDFTPIRGLEEFFEDSWFCPIDQPITLKEGENYTAKFRPNLRTINWKKFPLTKILQKKCDVEEAIDEAIAEGKDIFERFCSLLSENEELGKVSCTASLTVGRIWTKVKDKKLFENVKVIHEYQETIAILRKCLQSWDQLRPTKAEMVGEFLNPPRKLLSELKTNLQILETEVNEKNITQSILRRDTWINLSKARYYDEIRWFLIDRETNLKENLEELYKQMSKYNTRIQGLLYLGESRTEKDLETLNTQRVKLCKNVDKALKWLKTILVAQSSEH